MAVINPMDMAGRTVLVTGASSGIGRETAILLSQLGARLILIARDRARLAETLGLLESGDHVVQALDLASLADLPAQVKELAQGSGELYGLVHAAGRHTMRPLRALEPSELAAMMDIHVSAAVQLDRAFRQKGVHTSPASIVLLASVSGQVGQPGVSAYAASKGAVIALSRSLAMELAREGIRVNCVAPALVRTPMTQQIQQSLDAAQAAAVEAMHPLGIGEPRDVAHAIAFLLADTGRWITGTTLVVDGGYTAH